MQYGEFLELKEVPSEEGRFTGYASTFGNVDLQGDVVVRGAFTRTLRERKSVPILMAHKSDQIVGYGVSAEEDAKGLKVLGEFTLQNPSGLAAYNTTKHADARGHKLGLSIGYYIPEGGAEWDEKRGVRLLKDIDLMEYSIAATPANTRARITGVKSSAVFGKRAIEAVLLEKGLSRRDAVATAAEIYEELQRDAETLDVHTGVARDARTAVQRDAVPKGLIVRDSSVFIAQMRAVMLGR